MFSSFMILRSCDRASTTLVCNKIVHNDGSVKQNGKGRPSRSA